VNKKKQKNFDSFMALHLKPALPLRAKVFCALFFKKAPLSA